MRVGKLNLLLVRLTPRATPLSIELDKKEFNDMLGIGSIDRVDSASALRLPPTAHLVLYAPPTVRSSHPL